MPQNNKADYLKTLERMHTDAEILYEKREYYNCCYLCGYVLECALKYILLTFGLHQNGQKYCESDLKQLSHNTNRLNRQLQEWLSISSGISSSSRLDPEKMCPYIFKGYNGYPQWNPQYRYGEHPLWNTAECCEQYFKENNQIFKFISEMQLGGI